MATTKTSGIRCDELEEATWKATAERLGESFNQWARRALNEQAALDAALLKERDAVETELRARRPDVD